LRKVWSNEATDFTPWLGQEENLALLGESLGLDLELVSTEKGVGPFRADILCKDTVDQGWVLVENQLGRTDHSHLGQLITYAAGLDAVTVVWVARRFTDEHRAALDWLNRISPKEISFFGLEIELWRIGTSPEAPKFNIVSAPNEWTKGGGGGKQPPAGLTPLKQQQLEYWTSLMRVIEERGGAIRRRKPLPDSYTEFAVGRSGFRLIAETRNGEVSVSLTVAEPSSEAHFRLLEANRDEIEGELGEKLTWKFKAGRKQNYIIVCHPSFDVDKREEWPAQHEWIAGMLEQFHRVFAPRIRSLHTVEM